MTSSKDTLTSRDRLWRTLGYQEADRVPLFTPNIINTTRAVPLP